MMRNHLYLLPLIFLAACQSVEMSEELPALTEKPTQVQPVENDSTHVPEPEMNPLVELAITDLATHLNLDSQLVTVIDFKPVTWSDASLGCPQEGMMYAQVLTDGYLILLEANGIMYEYHAGKNSDPFYCENPLPPVPGMAGDT